MRIHKEFCLEVLKIYVSFVIQKLLGLSIFERSNQSQIGPEEENLKRKRRIKFFLAGVYPF